MRLTVVQSNSLDSKYPTALLFYWLTPWTPGHQITATCAALKILTSPIEVLGQGKASALSLCFHPFISSRT